MNYTFEILGVSPILYFFNHQQEINQKESVGGVEYLGSPKCTLDAFIESASSVPTKHAWDMDKLVDSIVEFWINNPEKIGLWRDRLVDAGQESLLIARVGSLKSLRQEFESLFKRNL